MKQSILGTVAAIALMPLSATAGTITTNLSFSNTQNIFNGGAGFNESANLNLGIATVDFGARASTGSVRGEASISLTAAFEDTLSFAEAAAANVGLTASNLRHSFETLIGATAFSGVNFGSFLGINPPRISLGEVGYTIETADARTGFGSTDDRAAEPITGFGVPTFPGISLQAEITLDGSQTSEMSVDELFGVVQATHEDGTILTDAFSLTSSANSVLDLGIAGEWDLELIGVGLANTFDTSLGLAASARVGAAVGFGCGDFSDDDDNGFFCAGDTGAVATSPQLTLINPAETSIAWGKQNLTLGTITVAAPVPLPAGVVLMATGFGALGLARRRRSKAQA